MNELQPESINPSCLTMNVQAITCAGSPDFVNLFLDPLPGSYKPGQFVMIRPEDWGNDPVWPRPFSICESNRDYLRLFIQVVGRGTRRIRQLGTGAKVQVWGPLGNGFRVESNKQVMILAGGMGIAPFVGFCKTHPRPEQLLMLFGHRADLHRYPWEELPEVMEKKAMQQKTDEAIVQFQKELKEHIVRYALHRAVMACGPSPFLKYVQECALQSGAEVQISLENKMACGVGACLGCVARTPEGEYLQSCTRGPVFMADQVLLDYEC
ncbi:hypothetical protein [Desulfonatronovibrio magnus]|uniref:iron-sulfur cluster-binding protein n=1 Tax=Desulfonatronovibrio magnus TaxID=698827 RepID=UPI000697E233|nr:hypothetical protein [Desulfonatronovibrio magnus]